MNKLEFRVVDWNILKSNFYFYFGNSIIEKRAENSFFNNYHIISEKYRLIEKRIIARLNE